VGWGVLLFESVRLCLVIYCVLLQHVFCDFIDRSERFLFFFSNGVYMVVFVIFFAMFSSFANMI
jgi:hypothetical protein